VNYKDMGILKGMEISTLKNATLRNQIKGVPHLVRYKLNLKNGSVRRRHLGKKKPRRLYPASHFDFPVINPEFRFQQYCYVYGVASRSDRKNVANTSLVKKDLCTHGKDRVINIPNHYFQEPQFIPRPNSVAEDDGILIVMAADGQTEKSYVAIFDAQTMVQINKAWLPTIIPFSLHGSFFPGQM
jgi:carotenoid cleavage dioxygenase-like enzyme